MPPKFIGSCADSDMPRSITQLVFNHERPCTFDTHQQAGVPFDCNGSGRPVVPLDAVFTYGTSTVRSLPMKVKVGRLRPFMYLAAVCERAVTRMGSAMVGSQET